MISDRPNLWWFGAIEVSLKPEVSRVYLDDPGCGMMIVYDWMWRRESQHPEDNRIHIRRFVTPRLTRISPHSILELAGFQKQFDFRLPGRRALRGQFDGLKNCCRDTEDNDQDNHQL